MERRPATVWSDYYSYTKKAERGMNFLKATQQEMQGKN